ncbi:MAG TPA: CAP domain-containing protein [Candidatus Acidoferrum sp.]
MNGTLRHRVLRILVSLALAAILVLCFVRSSFAAPAAAAARPSNSAEQMLYDAVNRERATLGLRQLQWDYALANAARLHTTLLASHDSLSHRFDGEADLQTRLRMAGASFSLVAENVAEAPDVSTLHIAWMNSAPHRANILDPQVDSIGIAIERRGEQYYATQDFAAAVTPLSREEQEQQVARLLQANGLSLAPGVEDARRSCDANRPAFGAQPAAIARFETSDLTRLPSDLGRMVTSGRFHRAAVGACELPSGITPFARFRLTVLLFP